MSVHYIAPLQRYSNRSDESSAREERIINLRAFAVICVVFGHSIIIYSESWGIYSSDFTAPVLSIVKDGINIFQMPLFIAISGYCLGYSLRSNFDPISFIKNKAIKLLIPYLLIGLAWMIPIRVAVNYQNYSENSGVAQMVFNFLFGLDSGHLWFLPTLFVIFIIVAFTKRFVSDRIFLSSMIVLSIFGFCAFCLGIDSVPFISPALHYFPAFCLGYYMYCQSNGSSDLQLSRMNSKLSVAFASIIIALLIVNPKVAASTCISLFVTAFLFVVFPRRSTAVVRLISEDSFGIYLFHSPLVYITFSLFPNIHPFDMILINFVLFGLVSVLIVEIIKKTRIKLVIGQ